MRYSAVVYHMVFRVVSPLSDPANPDANGTPIPFNRDYRVAGTFFTGMYEYDLKYVYVTLDSLQEFLDRGDAIDGIEIRVTNPYDSDAFVAEFQAAFGPSYRVQDWKELNRSLFSALKLEKIAMFLVLGIVILVASFSIVGNLIMVVVEKAREIALLKTLGATRARLLAAYGIEYGLLGLATALFGVAAGSVAAFFVVHDVMHLPFAWLPVPAVLVALAALVVTVALGLIGTFTALGQKPAPVLRNL